MKPQSNKSIIEAVVIAGLSAIVTGLVKMYLDRLDKRLDKKVEVAKVKGKSKK